MSASPRSQELQRRWKILVALTAVLCTGLWHAPTKRLAESVGLVLPTSISLGDKQAEAKALELQAKPPRILSQFVVRESVLRHSTTAPGLPPARAPPIRHQA